MDDPFVFDSKHGPESITRYFFHLLNIVIMFYRLFPKDLCKELEQANVTHASMSIACDQLLETCDAEADIVIADKESVTNEVKFLNSSWEGLNERLTDIKQHMENIETELVIFNDVERRLDDLCDSLDAELGKQRFVSAVPKKCVQIENHVKVRISRVNLFTMLNAIQ